MSNIQDLEQEVLRCWEVTQDLDLLAQEYEHDDDICNRVLGIKHVYDMRFNKAWDTYEKLVGEHYASRKREASLDKILADWGDEASEKRQDIVGANGPTGEHYEEVK
jgi:hypothetical protein